MAALRPGGNPVYFYGEERNGRATLCVEQVVLPRPGLALRLRAVVDRRRHVDRRNAPVTVDFLRPVDPPAPPPAAPQTELLRRFTCRSDDFILLFAQMMSRVEEWVAAAGLPPECLHSVYEFCRASASPATNRCYNSVEIVIEAGDPESLIEVEEEEEEEEVPADAVIEECAICYNTYFVGSIKLQKLPCNHIFHRKCIDHWMRFKRTCPYCRAPVPAPAPAPLPEQPFWPDAELPSWDEGTEPYWQGHLPLPEGDDLSPEWE